MDPYGRMLGRMNLVTGRRAILFADVPTQGVRTVRTAAAYTLSRTFALR